MRKAYIRHRDDNHPASVGFYYAWEGLHELGIETVPFFGFGDLPEDVSEDVMVVGYVGDILNSLHRLGLSPPERMDYPQCLSEFYGRKITKSTLGEIRNTIKKVFIKPSLEEKLFTGFVWDGSKESRIRIATYGDDVDVWVSEPVNFISEFRCYVLDREVLDVRRYKGIWSIHPDKEVINKIVDTFKICPVAYGLDVGVLEDYTTKIVEINDCYSLGNYGLNNVWYAKMLMARWKQLVTEKRLDIL